MASPRLIVALAASFDPEAQRVPGAAEDAALLDGGHHDQRHFGDLRSAGRRHEDAADALALGERRNQRVAALDLGLELAALALGHAQEHRSGGAELDGGLL